MLSPGMSQRVWSSDRSVEEEEISLMAMLETAFAMGCAYGIYRSSGSLTFFAMSAAVAPLLLLTTPQSAELTIRLAEIPVAPIRRVGDRLAAYGRRGSSLDALWIVLLLVGAVVAIIAGKVAATLITAVRHPVLSLSAIGPNWRRVVLYTDIRVMPELLPAEETIPANSPLRPFRVKNAVSMAGVSLLQSFAALKEQHPILRVMPFMFLPFFLLFFAIVILPALAYRWTLKSTALIWSPLLWVFIPTRNRGDLRLYLSRVRNRSVYKFTRAYSALVIAAIVVKLFTYYQVADILSTMDRQLQGRVLMSSLIGPDFLPPWQLAALINATLAWLLFFAVDFLLQDIDEGAGTPSNFWLNALMIITLIRNILGVYTSACAAYLIATAVDSSLFPPLGNRLFPWS
jgi:hypothetical protein